jgi:hypothetical protein
MFSGVVLEFSFPVGARVLAVDEGASDPILQALSEDDVEDSTLVDFRQG